jgi:hypothetical protein
MAKMEDRETTKDTEDSKDDEAAQAGEATKNGEATQCAEVSEEGEEKAKNARQPVWGAYTTTAGALIVGFWAEFLRALYGAVVNLTRVFGSPALGGLLLLYAGLMAVGAGALLWGKEWGRKVGAVSAGGVIALHLVWALGIERTSLTSLIVYVLLGAGALYVLLNRQRREAFVQPAAATEKTQTGIRILHTTLAGFALLCLAALLLIMIEPHVALPLV